jgi:Cu/Ag efflux pump CusA
VIRQIVALSVKFRVLVIGSAAVVVVLAAAQLSTAPVQTLPEFGPPQVQIQTEALGLSASEVEQLITVPMEQSLLIGLPWLDQIRSESAPGLSSIDLIFKPDTDPLKARQVVQERMTRVRMLPNVGTAPIIIQPLSSTSRVMMIGVSSHDLSLIDLSVLARWKIKPRLMGVPGVANVVIWGQRDRQLQVQVDPDKLRQNGVTLNQVIDTTGNALWVSPLTYLQSSTPGSGGFVETSNQRVTIQHVLPIRTAGDLSSVIIEGTAGRTIRLSQVATVVEDHQPLIGDALLSTGPGLMLVVQKLPEASTLEVSRGVDQALDELLPGLSGVQIDPSVYRADAYVDSAVRNLAIWALVGFLLLFVLLLRVLPWRVALITFITILLPLVAAAYVLYWRGSTFNLLAVGGLALALGVVIGDALIDLANIRRALREHRLSASSAPPSSAVAAASSAVRGPLGFGTLIVLIAALPVLFYSGVAGYFARPALLSYILAVLASWATAITVTPALAFILLRNEPNQQARGQLERFGDRLVDKTLPRYMRRPSLALATAAVLFVMGSAAATQLDGRSLLPVPQEPTVLVRLDTTPGTSLVEMERKTTALMGDIRAISGVRNVGAHIGRAATGDEVVNVNSGELWASLSEGADYNATVAAIGSVLRNHPDIRSDLETYPQDVLRPLRKAKSDALVVRVYGSDLEVLRSKADEIRLAIGTVDGVVRPTLQMPVAEPTLEVKVDLAAAQRYGLNPGDVRRAAATYFSGLLVGNLYEDQKIFDVVVRGSPAALAGHNLGDLPIDTPGGSQVRLGDLASIRVVQYPTVIRHLGISRVVDVTAEVNGRDINSVLSEVNERVETVQMPLEYHVEVFSDLAVKQNQLLWTVGFAVAIAIGILLLMQAAFTSWRLATAVFLAVPLGASGGVPAAILAGDFMTPGAMLGFFLVLGLTVRNCILLIRTCQSLESAEFAGPRLSLVQRATRLNAAPILLTASGLSALFLPLLFFGGVPGGELLHPMAAVVVGGMVTSTALTLLLVPVLYLTLATAHPEPPSTRPVDSGKNAPPAEAVVAAGVHNGEPAEAMPGT